jgi:hypothetical protein
MCRPATVERSNRRKIGAEFFDEEQRRICADVEAARREATEEQEQKRSQSDPEVRFEQVAAVLRDFDLESVWLAAEEQELGWRWLRSWSSG